MAELYARIRPAATEPGLDGCPPGLRPSLRRYQRQAAAWMAAREEGQLSASLDPGQPRLHPLWRQVPSLDGRGCLYVNPYTGARCPQRPTAGCIRRPEWTAGDTYNMCTAALII